MAKNKSLKISNHFRSYRYMKFSFYLYVRSTSYVPRFLCKSSNIYGTGVSNKSDNLMFMKWTEYGKLLIWSKKINHACCLKRLFTNYLLFYAWIDIEIQHACIQHNVICRLLLCLQLLNYNFI